MPERRPGRGEEDEMIKPVAGCGNRNKAEALYLLKGHEPRHRKHPDSGSSEAWERENYPPAETGNILWDSSMRRVQERDQQQGMEMEERLTSKITEEEEIGFLGPLPRNEDLPDWIREAIAAEDGGLGAKERCWPILIKKVRVGPEFQRHPWLYGAIYGLLRYHALTRDANDHPQTWVSVARLAEEAGYSVRRVESILRDMERLGMIITEMRSGRSSIYTLLLKDPGVVGREYDLVGKKETLSLSI
jgi:hypothetical protein